MPNPHVTKAVTETWSEETARVKSVLDLSCGMGATAELLKNLGYEVVATEYDLPERVAESVKAVSGVDLNRYLPFKDRTFDGVNIVEVIEHVEDQPQLIREIARVLKPGGVTVISTPNVLNAFSRLRFLFTGFLRGRVRPLHYQFGPGVAHNIHLIHFYELYYLLFHSGFDIVEIRKTRCKFASVLFGGLLYPLMRCCSFFAVIAPEKDPVQKQLNRRILKQFFSPALLLSDNIVVKARFRQDRTPLERVTETSSI